MHEIKRKSERYIFTHPIAFRLSEALTGNDNKGIILNICTHGACIMTPHHLTEGSEIVLESSLPALSLSAQVRWIEPVTRFFFRAGLEFKPEDETKKKQIRNLVAVTKKFSALVSNDNRHLSLEQVMA